MRTSWEVNQFCDQGELYDTRTSKFPTAICSSANATSYFLYTLLQEVPLEPSLPTSPEPWTGSIVARVGAGTTPNQTTTSQLEHPSLYKIDCGRPGTVSNFLKWICHECVPRWHLFLRVPVLRLLLWEADPELGYASEDGSWRIPAVTW